MTTRDPYVGNPDGPPLFNDVQGVKFIERTHTGCDQLLEKLQTIHPQGGERFIEKPEPWAGRVA